jgi:transposase
MLCLPEGSVVSVKDIAHYDRNAAVQAALSSCEHSLLVFWLPSYCPTLIPIERFWRHLKETTNDNKLVLTSAALRNNLQTLLTAQSQPDHPLRHSSCNALT